ncbi:MAG: V-type ATP synthase subunit D [Candidatus Latescibacterota bacterium]|nr:MAG: V-type ATP synthase subunit D [Candidatus Latescibacterota bacterium]RKY72060.1 MAG: V-type ATP synthase subunit D [Candidatus Latescibacterota bacterium]
MKLQVSATRMELLRLKKRLDLARRGHKLLKDKQDELMRQLLSLIETLKGLRTKVEKELLDVYQSFLTARLWTDEQMLEEALSFPSKVVQLQVEERRIMNLRVPVLKPKLKGEIYCYGFAHTPGELDACLKKLDSVLENMVKLSEAEKTLQLLADEIEKTRRRVNALEYILIPNLQQTIKYIEMRLEEIDLETLTRLMRVKEIIRGE